MRRRPCGISRAPWPDTLERRSPRSSGSNLERTLGALPDGVTRATRLGGSLDVAVFFATSRAALEKRFPAYAKAIAPAGSLWISWPKKSSGKKTDLDENIVRAVGLERGLVDVKVCAVDETWSGLKFVVRLADRPKK